MSTEPTLPPPKCQVGEMLIGRPRLEPLNGRVASIIWDARRSNWHVAIDTIQENMIYWYNQAGELIWPHAGPNDEMARAPHVQGLPVTFQEVQLLKPPALDPATIDPGEE